MSKTINNIYINPDSDQNGIISLLIVIMILLMSVNHYGQSVDITTPQLSSFNSGQSIEGFIQNSINEATGKVTFGVPIASISARGVSYSVALTYDGKSSFDTGSNTNKYNPVSTVGVGFSLPISKIVTDNKGTASQEDDDFFLQDGNNTKLFCTNKIDPGNLEGEIIWEFQAEKYIPWKIKYYKSEKFDLHGVLVERPLDYWMVIDDKGTEYVYGETQNARENMVAWGNWIGNSKKNGGSRETIVWNLSTIKDQWDNNISFEYELQENFVGNVKQTEASYIKKIVSSTGENIRFNYANKSAGEFYEPHIEYAEPDAYQERYEKRYLQNIATYNSSNGLMYTYNFAYAIENNSSSNDKKRYLSSITQENEMGETLPNQKFEYHTTGDFKGGIKKIIYPMGSSVTYNYENKTLFTNSPNNYTGSAPNNFGYNYYSIATKENYTLMLLKSKSPIRDGKHRFKVVRYTWNGQNWTHNSFVLPYLIKDTQPATGVWLENFQSVFGAEYYGFMHNDGNFVRMDLFHLKPDGINWHHKTEDNLNVGAGRPSLISGTEFVAIGGHHNGKLHMYNWNLKRWDREIINQGVGQYYYGATNNFILSLDEDGGNDMVTGVNHEDNYYIHYLDAQKNWITKSWSAAADPYIHGIEKPSYFYPGNAMAGFVADDNPELFLRWDENYNLLRPDNVLGSVGDTNPIIPTYSGMFTLQNWFYQHSIKYARFNGVNWNVFNLPTSSSYYAKPSYGEDFATFQNHGGNHRTGYVSYNPNTDGWEYTNGLNTYPWYSSNNKLTGMASDFLIAGNQIYKFSNTSLYPIADQTLPFTNVFSHTDGLSHGFIKLASHTTSGSTASENFEKGMYVYMNKKNNQISTIDLGKKYHMVGPIIFAGRTPFISTNAMWLRNEGTSSGFSDYLYRIIDDKVNNVVKDIVVTNVQTHNGNNEVRETVYTYLNPNSTRNNDFTFYENVTIENKGYGSSSIGKITKTYHNGSTDAQMAGLLLEEVTKDTNGITISHSISTFEKYDAIPRRFSIKQTKQESNVFYDGKAMTNITETTYNFPYFLPVKTKRTNSKGQIEEVSVEYAFTKHQYSEMDKRNFLSHPSQITTKVNGQTVSVKKTNWIAEDKIYASETWSGNSNNNLRKIREVTKMNVYGQVLETTNGRDQYKCILYGYNNKYPVARISNAKYNDVINNLDITESALQGLNNSNLKSELSKLYSRIPNAMIKLGLYDIEGKIVTQVNERQREIKNSYDSFNRLDYISDHNNNVLKKNIYNYKTE